MTMAVCAYNMAQVFLYHSPCCSDRESTSQGCQSKILKLNYDASQHSLYCSASVLRKDNDEKTFYALKCHETCCSRSASAAGRVDVTAFSPKLSR